MVQTYWSLSQLQFKIITHAGTPNHLLDNIVGEVDDKRLGWHNGVLVGGARQQQAAVGNLEGVHCSRAKTARTKRCAFYFVNITRTRTELRSIVVTVGRLKSCWSADI